jgi:hypothetical protein
MQNISVVGLFCEDIREEKTGADTIIGVLPDNLNVPKLPAFLPKLCLYVRIHVNSSFDPGPISVHLAMPDGSVIAKIDLEPELVRTTLKTSQTAKAPIAGFISKFILSPFQIVAPGRIQAVANVDGGSYVCGALYVNEQPQQVA